MTVILKRFAGNIVDQNNVVTAYTVPLNYKTIVKSFFISNGSASTVSVTVRFANNAIMYNYVMKPNDAIAVPVVDQLLIAGNTITISATAANSISYYISGLEALTTDPEYSDVLRFGIGTVPVSSGVIASSSSKDRLVKGIVLCNTFSSDARISMEVFGLRILQAFTVKASDTILIPTIDLLIPASEYITASASSGGVHYYITGKEL
ncbi:hypothetical protein [Paenibacillus pabuli]|uniref:hypothetical protein n=1 Tax=Paenibacillus pabuli TaxID=1472 RepID=UPI001FFF2625|nr:hypothetical protein [Paenibacillus pabuli]UPK45905.1 hypothetical protein KET34_10815 [Paenibacillus pabuli]